MRSVQVLVRSAVTAALVATGACSDHHPHASAPQDACTLETRTTAPWLDVGGRDVLADVNKDGKLDLIAVRATIETGVFQTVHVRLGAGDGTFSSALDVAGPMNMQDVVAADVDGDTNPDLLVTTMRYGNPPPPDARAQVYLLRGNGDGTFASPEVVFVDDADSSTTYLDAPGIAAADLDGDGHTDVIVSTMNVAPASPAIVVLLGKGDGTFATPVSTPSGPGASPFILVVDVDHDGKLDVVQANLLRGTSVLRGNGDGTLNAAAALDPGLVTSVVDVNADGAVDLVEGDSQASGPRVLLGRGDGTYQAVALDNPGTVVHSVAGDFDGDGHVDLVTGGNAGVTLHRGAGDGTFATAIPFVTVGANQLLAGDLDGDHLSDLAVVDFGTTSIHLGAADPDPFNLFRFARGAAPLVAADLDGDGATDLATNGQILLNRGGILSPGAAGVYFDVLADVDGDGKLDAVTPVLGEAGVAVQLGNGDGTFAAPVLTKVPGSCYGGSVAVADFDGDGIADVAMGGTNAMQDNPKYLLCIYSGSGDGSFRRVVPDVELGDDCHDTFTVLGTLDANRDHHADLLVACVSSTHVLLGDGHGSFHSGFAYPITSRRPLVIADLDRDGLPDLVQVDGPIAISRGHGDGTFGPVTFVDDIPDARGVAAGDVDRDGVPDLLVARDASTTILLGNGDGSFRIGTDYTTHLPGWGAALLDLDGDGLLDFATAVQEYGIAYRLNRCTY